MTRYKIAFVKFGGLSAGGTERWLQMMAAHCNKDIFDIDFYYCDAAPYVSSEYKHPNTDPERKNYLETAGINLIQFNVGAKDIQYPHHPWVDTNFWDVFDCEKYDLVQTGKAGHCEYPYYLMHNKIVEYVALAGMVDKSPNIAMSILASHWSRNKWILSGGDPKKSDVIYVPVNPPVTQDTYKNEFNIPEDAIVCGFHQRNDNNIFSPIQLQAISNLNHPNIHILILNGGDFYKKQAAELKIENIHFIPYGDQYVISKFLNTIDIFTHGRSDGETFGTAIAEAMIHGKPCISHFVPSGANAMAETIGPSGYVVNSIDEYCVALTKLIENSNYRKDLGNAGQIFAQGNYSIESAVTHLENIWLQILEPKKIGFNSFLHFINQYKIPYGKTKLGFYYAGLKNDPSEIAHSLVKCKSIPEPFDVGVFSSFIPFINSFIDIGSNTGLYSVIAAALGRGKIKIHAFEPQEKCYNSLLKTIRLNHWEDRLSAHCLGLGESVNTLTFHLTGSGSTFYNDFNDNECYPKKDIQVIPLDLFLSQNRITYVDFIKIDVEGFELSVLKGGEKTIDLYQPVLFIEIADNIVGRKFKNPHYNATLNWIREKGYQIYRCTEDNQIIHLNDNTPYHHIAMYLCVKEIHSRAMEYLNDNISKGQLLNLPMTLASQN